MKIPLTVKKPIEVDDVDDLIKLKKAGFNVGDEDVVSSLDKLVKVLEIRDRLVERELKRVNSGSSIKQFVEQVKDLEYLKAALGVRESSGSYSMSFVDKILTTVVAPLFQGIGNRSPEIIEVLYKRMGKEQADNVINTAVGAGASAVALGEKLREEEKERRMAYDNVLIEMGQAISVLANEINKLKTQQAESARRPLIPTKPALKVEKSEMMRGEQVYEQVPEEYSGVYDNLMEAKQQPSPVTAQAPKRKRYVVYTNKSSKENVIENEPVPNINM